MHDTIKKKKKAVLFFTMEKRPERFKFLQAEVAQAELKKLVTNIGLQVLGIETFRLEKINPATYIGSGQLERAMQCIQETDADVAVFNAEISPRMQRNLEEALGVCVIDREEVIIQIFADRAQTAEAKLQAELASLQYSLPRLTRKWTELSQQRGGAFLSRGAGETKLELNRRTTKERITTLRKKLREVQKIRQTQRKNRLQSDIKTGSIVGYTNSGKSSLLKALSKKDIKVKNKLFATLDAQTKRVCLSDGSFVLLTDTVGFVDNLPHHLIDAFRSTLEEAKYNDFCIIVCDASHPTMLACLDVTLEVLHSLGCDEKKRIIFVNKMDSVCDPGAVSTLKHKFPNALEGSVKTGEGLEKLSREISNLVS